MLKEAETGHGMPLNQETLDRVVRSQLSVEGVVRSSMHCVAMMLDRVEALEKRTWQLEWRLGWRATPKAPHLRLVERAPDDGTKPAPKRGRKRKAPKLRLIVTPQEHAHAT